MTGPTSDAEMVGGAGDDHLYLYDAANDITLTGDVEDEGGAGNNVFYLNGVSNGTITVLGSDGNDSLTVTGVTGGTVNLGGGDGENNFYIDNVTAGTVNATGGEGADTFRLGSVTGEGSVEINGGTGSTGEEVLDVLELTGANGANVTFGEDGTVTIDDIELVTGTAANDVIDASGVISALTVDGGAGNDVLTGGDLQTLLGGAGDDKIILGKVNAIVDGGAGTDTLSLTADEATLTNGHLTFTVESDTKTIDMTSIEVIEVSSTGGTITLDDKVSGSIIDFGAGTDKLILTENAAGSTLYINNYDWRSEQDSIVAPDGAAKWSYTDSTVPGGTKRLFSNGEDSITVYLNGYTTINKSASTSSVTLTANPGGSYTGSTKGDKITANLGGNGPMYVATGGAPSTSNRDTVEVNVLGDVEEGFVTLVGQSLDGLNSSHSRLVMKGDGVEMTFEDKTIGADDSSTTVAALTEIVSGDYTASLEAYGFSKYWGTEGTDTIHANNTNSTFEYEVIAGDDEYHGGDGIDQVIANPGKSNAMMLDGGGEPESGVGESNDGGPTADWVRLEGGPIEVTLNSEGGVTKGDLTFDGKATDVVITDFEIYNFDDKADVVNASAFVTTAEEEKSIYVNSNGGDDTFNLTGTIADGKNFFASGGDGDDTFNVGTVSTPAAEDAGIQLNGDAGNDTYNLQADGYSLTINEMGEKNGADKIQFYGLDANTVGTTDEAKIAYLERLTFEYTEGSGEGEPGTLTISGVKTSDSQTLTFKSNDFTGDTLSFLDASGNNLLGGVVDLSSIVGSNPNGTNPLEFSFSNGRYTAAPKADEPQP